MSDSSIPLNPGSGGKALDTEAIGGLERSRTQIGGAALNEIARVQGTAPSGTEMALVVRPIPSGTQPVSIASAVPVTDGGGSLTVDGTVGVSGTVTVTGTVALSGTSAVSAASLPLPTGAATQATLASVDTKTPALVSGRVPVDGSGVTQPVSLAAVSIGTSAGKTLAMTTATITTTATTANQVIVTYTVPSGQTLYLEYFQIMARLTTYATTATNYGTATLQINGVGVYTVDIAHAGVITPLGHGLTEPLPVAQNLVVRWVCTPSATTSFRWVGNFGGYTK